MKGPVVFKKRELLVPEGYLEKVLKAHSDGLAYALHRSADKTPNIVLERGEGKYTIKDIMDIQNDAVEEELILWFMQAEKFYLEDMMPMTILGDEKAEGGPMIVGFADGKFPNFIPQASDHSNEYFLFNKYLIPKLTKLGKDANAIFNCLDDDLVKIELNALNGHIVLLSHTGRVIPFGEGRREFEWGWVTDACGYEEVAAADVPVLQQAARKVGQMLRRKTDDRSVATTRPVASVQPIVQPPKTDTAVPEQEVKEFTFQPEQGTSFKEMKKQYKRITGALPNNWRDRPVVRYKRTVEVTTVAKPAAAKPTVVKSFQEIDKSKYATQVTASELPLMGPKLIEAIQADFKNLDKQSTAIPDPEKILKDMEKIPSFWQEAAEIPKNFTDAADWEWFKAFAGKYPMAMAKLAWSYRNLEVTGEEEEPVVTTEALNDKVDTSGSGVVRETTGHEEKAEPAEAPAVETTSRRKPQMLKRKTG